MDYTDAVQIVQKYNVKMTRLIEDYNSEMKAIYDRYYIDEVSELHILKPLFDPELLKSDKCTFSKQIIDGVEIYEARKRE